MFLAVVFGVLLLGFTGILGGDWMMLGDPRTTMFGDRMMLGDWRRAETGGEVVTRSLLLWRAIPVFGEVEL